MTTKFILGIAGIACAAAIAQVQMASIGHSSLSQVVPPPAAYRFPTGERLTYSVQWHMFNAGTAIIFMQRSGLKQHLTSKADSAGFANKIFPVHDTFDADIDPRFFCTQQISKHNEEGSKRLDRR